MAACVRTRVFPTLKTINKHSVSRFSAALVRSSSTSYLAPSRPPLDPRFWTVVSPHATAQVGRGISGPTWAWGRYASTATAQVCWNCHQPVEGSIFFGPCGALQPPNSDYNYFQIMDIPVTFDVDMTQLHDKFRDLQRLLHPDKYSQKSDIEQEYSEGQSALVNKAYRTLSRPVARGLYMLGLHGLAIEEGDSHVGSAFLVQIMELNEEIEEIAMEGAAPADLHDVSSANDAALEGLYAKVGASFEEGNISQAKLLLIKAKYYVSAQDRIKNILNRNM